MRRWWLIYGLFALVLAILAPILAQFGIVDDAWITYAYARNLAHGHGIVFNPGEIVEGCTAFLHMVLLAPFAWVTVRLDRVAQAINILAWAGVASLVWSTIRRRDGGPVGVQGLFFTAFALVGFSGLAWTYSGMEMPLVALAWIGAARLHLWEREAGRLPWASALVSVTAGLLRPDGILVAPALAVSTWWLGGKKLNWKGALTYSAIVLGLFGGYWLWRWHYFGYPLPNTFYAKVTTTSVALTITGVWYVVRWLLGMVVPAYGVVAMIVARGLRPVPRWIRVMQGLVATSIGYCLLVGADFFSYHRFLLPAYAPMVLVTWWYGVGALERLRRGRTTTGLSRTGKVVAAICLLVALQFVYFIGRYPPQGLVHAFIVQNTEDWSLVARKFPSRTPLEAKIATIPIGAMRYFSDRYILDLVGLTDVHIAHTAAPTGVAITGHEKYDIDYVMQRRPELIFTWPGLMPAGLEGLQKWVMSNIGAQAQKKLMTDPRTPENYQFVWMLIDEPVAIRRGSMERWQGLKQLQWAGPKQAKGVIGLLRRDLVGRPEYAAFVPMEAREAAWLWETFSARDVRDLYRRFFEARRQGI